MSEFKEYLQREENKALADKLKVCAWILSAVVLGLVGLMRRVKFSLPEGVSVSFLPPVHALLNSIVALCLVGALVAIKQKNILWHKRLIHVAMLSSTLFLLCYVTYHFTTAETRYPEDAPYRGAYLLLLVSHIVLAAVSLPFILFTWVAGVSNQFGKHKKLARWVFPLWLYVALTGPICYLMLRPYYS